MKTNLYIVGVVWLCILRSTHAQVINRSDFQNFLSDATSAESNNRQRAESTLGQQDQSVLQLNPGERNRQIQTVGNRENDFLDFSEVQIQGVAITQATGESGLSSGNFLTNNTFIGTFSVGDDAPGFDGRRGPAAFMMMREETAKSCVFDQANRAVCNTTTKFRTPSGHCNNLGDNTKTFGMAGTAFGRARSPTYQDGVQSVRTQTHFTNQTLPDARRVSFAATTINIVLDDLGFSNQIMQWGQFVAHDLTSIADTEPGAICCPEQHAVRKFNTSNPTQAQISEARAEIESLRGEVCIAIESSNDPVLGNVCMNQVRSATVPTSDCSPSPRLQQNTATHFCDGSGIYGSSTVRMDSLRTRRGGKLKVQMVSGNELPPKENASCSQQFCPFAAGDPRIDTTPNLITTHTLFIRKHNQIASELSGINPQWNDERIFQETRRIVSAIVQNIHFNEWIQHLLDTRLDKYDLRKSFAPGHRDTYDVNVDPSLLNEFAGAALRFGHTTVGGIFQCAGPNRLFRNFNKPDIIYQDGINECLAGMAAADKPWKFDKNFVEDMRDRLFNLSLDIVALNINRGRDHGFDSYAQYRRQYGFPAIMEWSDLDSSHDSATRTMLESIYTDPKDIELYIGGVTEKKQQNGYIGPLFAEILGDGLNRVRNGDRFYFESPSAGFTTDQVNALKAYRYSNLICDVGGVSSTPTDAFRMVSESNNPALICLGSPQLNLELWKEDDPDSCSWNDSRSKCCNKRQTIKRTCIGGDSCRPGVVGCSGSATLTETCQPTCPSTNPNCNSDTGCLETCSWKIDSRSKCCNKRQTIKRTCIGGDSCRPGVVGCSGSATLTETCQPTCPSTNPNCNSDTGCLETCSWRGVKYGTCCSGIRTITRQCTGGDECRSGVSGCSGEATTTQPCRCNSKYDVACNIGCSTRNDNCGWQIRSTGECCNGYRAVRKSCVGGSSCQEGQGGCRGVATILQRCIAKCPWYNRNCECQ